MSKYDYLAKTLDRLRSVTAGCREDMHEPDEQGLGAEVYGTRLDNAFDNEIIERRVQTIDHRHSYLPEQEIVLALTRDVHDDDPSKETHRVEVFNLATLIALARLASLPQTFEPEPEPKPKSEEPRFQIKTPGGLLIHPNMTATRLASWLPRADQPFVVVPLR